MKRANEPTHHLVDPNTAEGAASGQHGVSTVNCRHLYTVRQSLVIKKIGVISTVLIQDIDACLQAALNV